MTRYLIPLITALVLATTACATSPRQITPADPHATNDPGYHNALTQCAPLLENPVPGYFCIGPAVIVAPVVLIAEISRAACQHDNETKFRDCMTDRGYPITIANPPNQDAAADGKQE